MIKAIEKPPEPAPAEAPTTDAPTARPVIAAAAALLVLLLATHWTTFNRMADRWAHDPQYSHGFIVPLFALVVLWSRREMLKQSAWKPAWAGLGLLLVGAVLRVIAVQIDIEPLDALSLLLTVFGLVLL